MTFKEKMKVFLEKEKLSQSKFCEILGINYVVFNRYVKEDKYSIDFIDAFKKHFPDADLNWFLVDRKGIEYQLPKQQDLLMVSEPQQEYFSSNNKYLLDRLKKNSEELTELIKELTPILTRI